MDAIFTALLTRSFWSQSQLWWLMVNPNVRSELLCFLFFFFFGSQYKESAPESRPQSEQRGPAPEQ